MFSAFQKISLPPSAKSIQQRRRARVRTLKHQFVERAQADLDWFRSLEEPSQPSEEDPTTFLEKVENDIQDK